MENTFITLENIIGQKKLYRNLIGKGKTRIVYDSNSIFKVAKDYESIINNILEYYLFTKFPNGCFAKIFSHTKDFRVIECEKAICKMDNKDECRKIYDAIYKKMFINGTESELLKALDNRKDYYRIYETYNEIWKMDILEKSNDIKKVMGEAISEWNTGYIGNEIYIIDYGLHIFYKKSFLEKLKKDYLKQ